MVCHTLDSEKLKPIVHAGNLIPTGGKNAGVTSSAEVFKADSFQLFHEANKNCQLCHHVLLWKRMVCLWYEGNGGGVQALLGKFNTYAFTDKVLYAPVSLLLKFKTATSLLGETNTCLDMMPS